jgi:DnaJ-class molecular chaperone
MTVKEKGMPFHKNPFKFGNLFILFKVKLPLTITPSEQGSIRKLFQSINECSLSYSDREKYENEKGELKLCEKYEKDHRNTHHQGGNEAHDSDNEHDEDNAGV